MTLESSVRISACCTYILLSLLLSLMSLILYVNILVSFKMFCSKWTHSGLVSHIIEDTHSPGPIRYMRSMLFNLSGFNFESNMMIDTSYCQYILSHRILCIKDLLCLINQYDFLANNQKTNSASLFDYLFLFS